MKFFLDHNFPKPSINFNHEHSFLLLGSCFSDEMAVKFKKGGFYVQSNPFGTIFHPLSLANVVTSILDNTKSECVSFGEKWFSWDMSHKLLFSSSNELEKYRYSNCALSKEILMRKNAVLILTFGTAWGYRRKDNKEIVANCHKYPTEYFTKELTSIEEMYLTWKDLITRLKLLNPNLTICFTVSPVRHIRDGLIENNRSKSRCMETIQQIQDEFSDVHYIPSYELVIDILRDYRFYGLDRVHPTEEAISYVWSYFCDNWIREDAKLLISETEKYYRQSDHRLQTEDSLEITQHTNRLNQMKEILQGKGAHF